MTQLKIYTQILGFLLIVLSLQGCSTKNMSDIEDDMTSEDEIGLITVFNVVLSAQFTVPANAHREETGTAVLKLYEDNALEFSIEVNDLSATDVLNFAHVHTGGLVLPGHFAFNLVDNINTFFNGNTASGTIFLSDNEVEILTGSDIYVNIHSSEISGGLLSGPIDRVIDFAMDIPLATDTIIPPLMGRNETGIVFLRLDTDSNLHYRILIDDLDLTDQITSAHINFGSMDENGAIFVTLAESDSDLSISKLLPLNTFERGIFLNDPLYINVLSIQEPSGLLRGQIR